jgi:hypothetical protein
MQITALTSISVYCFTHSRMLAYKQLETTASLKVHAQPRQRH